MKRLEVGEYVFHKSKERGTYPCRVERVGRGGRIKVTDLGWVSAHRCILQDDWRKENEQ